MVLLQSVLRRNKMNAVQELIKAMVTGIVDDESSVSVAQVESDKEGVLFEVKVGGAGG